jgi:hypothetical protein
VTVGGCQCLTYVQEHLIVAQFSLSFLAVHNTLFKSVLGIYVAYAVI